MGNKTLTTRNRVYLQIEEEPDLLKRVTLLNTAFIKVLTGGKLVKVISADYKVGCLDFIVECKSNVRPRIKRGRVNVFVEQV